jgi:gliding motility-associated-like protein
VKFDEGGGELTIHKQRTCETYEMTLSVSNAPVIEYYWEITNADGQVIKFTTASPHYDFTKAGKYHVYVEVKVQGCDGIIIIEDDIVVTDIIKLSADKEAVTYCFGDIVNLSAKLNIDGTISWYNQKGENIGVGESLTYKPVKDEIITIIGTDEYDCGDTLTVKLNEYKFDLSYNDPGVVCKGDTISLEIKNNTSNNLQYLWSGENIVSGANTNIVKVIANVNTTYSVTITDTEIGCDTILSVPLIVSTIDVSIEINTDTVVITNSVTVEVLNVPANSTILWSTGEKNTTKITITPQSTPGGVFSYVETICVTVSDEFGCEDKECIDITVIDPPCNEDDIYFPNAFSPNADGANDTFRPRGNYIRNIEMEIYSRWGELLYKGSGDKNLSWNGKSKDKELTPDTYTYRILVQCDDNDNYNKVSNVSLIK